MNKLENDLNAVWELYLNASERGALTELLSELSGKPADTGQEASTIQDRLAAMRQGYDNFVARYAPPPAEVKSEPFSNHEVRGLWFKPANGDPDQVLLYFHGGGCGRISGWRDRHPLFFP